MSTPAPARPAAAGLLLVIVDDLRADHLTLRSSQGAETPFLDRLAARSVGFSRCFSPCGWTLPACASLLTGRMPSEHGLIHHDRRFGAPKIPALLGPGWASFGVGNNGNFVPDHLSRETLDALGFERRPEVWKHFGWQEGFETYEWFHKQDKDGPFRVFAEWLSGRDGDRRPWFAMLHTNVVHDYDEERPWSVDVERFLGRPLHASLRRFRDGPHLWQTPPDGVDTETLREELLAKYRGCVAEGDRRLAAALEPVDLEQTVVVVVGDHGEGFDAVRGRVHHCGRLHDDLLRVPLLLSLPAGTPGAPAPGTVVDTPCSLLDVAPTLLRLAGAAATGLPGADLRELPEDREIHAEDHGYLYLPPGDVAPALRRYDYKTYDVESKGVVRWPRKSVRVRIGRQHWSEEYDLELDPLERINRAVGPQAPTRRPRRQEGKARAAWRALRADSAESRYLRFARGYPRFVSRVAARRRLPPVEAHRTYEDIAESEPITFIVAVADPSELRRHVLASACYAHGGHQWLFVENAGNRAYSSISALYAAASGKARHDLRFYVHQDVYFPPDWEDRLFRALAGLEREDPEWGVVGAAGRAPAVPGGEAPNVGHWSDPHKYHEPTVPLPARVQVLDELWLGVRASRGLGFDPDVPGFHCYGADLCMTARSRGLSSYVIDAPVVHKLFLPDGTLIERSDQSHKIEDRRTDEFRADFLRTARHVATKWRDYLPFQSTCHRYEVADAAAPPREPAGP